MRREKREERREKKEERRERSEKREERIEIHRPPCTSAISLAVCLKLLAKTHTRTATIDACLFDLFRVLSFVESQLQVLLAIPQRCTMAKGAKTTNIKTRTKDKSTNKQAPFCLFVRRGDPIKKVREATTFQKMDWSKLDWRYVTGYQNNNGSGCDAEYFLAHHLVGTSGHNFALCRMDRTVIFNHTSLDTLPSGTKVEYWRVSDLPKRQQSKCYWWGGEE